MAMAMAIARAREMARLHVLFHVMVKATKLLQEPGCFVARNTVIHGVII